MYDTVKSNVKIEVSLVGSALQISLICNVFETTVTCLVSMETSTEKSDTVQN